MAEDPLLAFFPLRTGSLFRQVFESFFSDENALRCEVFWTLRRLRLLTTLFFPPSPRRFGIFPLFLFFAKRWT